MTCLSFPIRTLGMQTQAPNFQKRFALPKLATISFRNSPFSNKSYILYTLHSPYYTYKQTNKQKPQTKKQIWQSIRHVPSIPRPPQKKKLLPFHQPALVQTTNFPYSAQGINYLGSIPRIIKAFRCCYQLAFSCCKHICLFSYVDL